MHTTQGYTLSPTTHALRTILAKGFDGETVRDTFANPTEVYPSRSHPGQYRVTGNGLCLVGEPSGDRFILITVYLDRVLTAPREDQLDTPEGRRFAQRYESGQGRG